jgi:heme-degrading monooxygenase HmoA
MHVIIWEFRPAENRRDDFEATYGPQGPWAKLFARAPGYAGTELIRDVEDPTRYVTIDRWQTAEAYEEFKARFSAEYNALDMACVEMTSAEVLVGTFQEI